MKVQPRVPLTCMTFHNVGNKQLTLKLYTAQKDIIHQVTMLATSTMSHSQVITTC